MTATRRRLAAPLVAAVLALGVVACGDDSGDEAASSPAASEQASAPTATEPMTTEPAPPAAGAETSKVDIADFKFKPADITVKAGAEISWSSSDDAPHNAVADDGAFETDTIQKGETKTATVAKPGTYSYICTFHPFMKGTVVVE